jgi:hypothetical protein
MIEPEEKLPLKSDVDNRLKRIANVLLLNANFIDNIGLLNGKMGIAIFFYQYSRYINDMVYSDYAGELIDEIYQEINSGTNVSFEDGLTGIGWGIEYLIRNNFVQADSDEALAEIDNALYRSRINSPILIKNGNDLFGYGLYYISRLNGREINDNDLNSLIKKYHLIFLVDECERIIVQNQYKLFKIDSLSVETLNSFIWFILEMHHLSIFPFKTEKVIQALPGFIDSSLLSSDDVSAKIQMKYLSGLLLPYIMNMTARDLLREQMNNTKLEEHNNLLSDEIAIDCFIKNSWQQIVYEPYFTSEQKHGNSLNRVFSAIDSEDNWNSRLDSINKNNLGLTGLAGLGIGLLSARSVALTAKTPEQKALAKMK